MVIGVTGGVGAGKSTVLEILKSRYSAHIIKADDVARELQEPGRISYSLIVKEFGQEILKDGEAGISCKNPELSPIDREKLGKIIFNNKEKMEMVNRMTHPFVMDEIKRRIATFYMDDDDALIAVEAALLIEVNSRELFNDMWCVVADSEVRISRLMSERGYSRKRCEDIMANQRSNEEFIEKTDFAIDSSGELSDTEEQITSRLQYLNVI